MDWSRFPLERLFYFIAGVVPGFVALWIFQLGAPGSFDWFFRQRFLRYNAKLALAVLATLVVGNTITTFLRATLSALGGVVGGVMGRRPLKLGYAYDVAPWRDPNWRTALKGYLGAQAPRDTSLMSPAVFEQRSKMAELMPEEQRQAALGAIIIERCDTALEDRRWQEWYDHYHQIILQDAEPTFEWHVQNGFNFNMQATALFVLVSATFVPDLRHWWYVLPACAWLIILVSESYSTFIRYTNKWSTRYEQIKYLSQLPPIGR